ncbi:hypothetical protein GCM10010399_42290 [Dactylosporangium fulvum]|uniref:Uncharacterized protein n=1 Tax=Dactylosporangium fulvum TaxID=53359 RepID=A0ABY5VWU3_9ACTN|nr:hypothetical protein [Dactylosporangium fulvum]UWP81591.1 hypothetical protein Dfulv_41815 [Dactylosporangium fulvum]
MTDLFALAADAFLAGDLALAKDAYGQLLGVFDLDQEVGTFCGPSSPSDMVATDVPEAVARYLRAVFETTPLSERAEELYDRYADLGRLAPATSLHAIADTLRNGLPDLDDFLPAWIEVLTEHTGGYWARDRQRLLTEATVWHAGTDSLATVARRPGDHQPTTYLDWINALTRDGRLDDAAAAAREATTITGLPAERSAEVADRLGELTARLGDPQAALDARRTAWRTHRTRSRLLALVVAADAAGQRAGTLKRQQWFDAARSVADRRIDAVVGNKHRGAYHRVAVLAVAYAEALALAADQAAGAAFITATRSRYPRHVAFRDELDRATAAVAGTSPAQAIASREPSQPRRTRTAGRRGRHVCAVSPTGRHPGRGPDRGRLAERRRCQGMAPWPYAAPTHRPSDHGRQVESPRPILPGKNGPGVSWCSRGGRPLRPCAECLDDEAYA